MNRNKIICILFIAVIFNKVMIQPILAQPLDEVVLEITGEGVSSPLQFTLSDLQSMEQYQQVYSTVNTWPTKRWYIAEGVKLKEILKLAGIQNNARLIKFTSSDSYSMTMTVEELLKDKRYYYPNFMETGYDGSIAGSTEGAQEVEPILALISSEGSNNPYDMNDMNSLLMICGQRAVTEQTNHLFLKHVSKIEVLTTEPLKWENPKAKIGSHLTLEEALLELSNKGNDTDKVYYTTDGSTPTINSPMFNWSAKRWQGQRPDDIQQINKALKINKDTVIKAITIGPGKKDSDVVTFTFSLDPDGKVTLNNKIPKGITLDQNYLTLPIGGTFQLDATLNIEGISNPNLNWTSSNTKIVTVDNNGLITVVAEGKAIVTAKEPTSNNAATCTVIGVNKEKIKKEIIPDDEIGEVTEIFNNYKETVVEEMRDEQKLANERKLVVENQRIPSNSRHLAKKSKGLDVNSPPSFIAKEKIAGQIYEVSLESDTFKLDNHTELDNFILGGSFLIFFSLGASTRYREIKREAN